MKQVMLTIVVLFTAFMRPVKAQDSTTKTAFNQVLSAYFDTKNALAKDDAPLAGRNAGKLIKSLDAFKAAGLTTEQQAAWKKQSLSLRAAIEPITKEKDLKVQRKSFERVASAAISMVKTFNLNNAALYVQYCPMVKRSWLNEVEAVQNPFYGSKMYSCGEVTETISKK